MRAVASHGRNYSHLPRRIKCIMISSLRKDQGRKGKEHRQGGSPIFFSQKQTKASPKNYCRSNKGFFPPFFWENHWNPSLFSGYLQHGFRTVLALTSGGCLATTTAKRCRGWCNAARRAAKTTTTGGSEWQNRWCFFLWSKSRWISGTPKRHQP